MKWKISLPVLTMDSSSNIKQDIIQKYISQTLETGASPTFSQICRDLQIPEKEFFKNFPNIEAVEAEHWWNVMDHNIRCCENSSEWSNYNAQQRLLAFYFQYFDDALEHRSLLLIRFFRPPVHGCGARFQSCYDPFQRICVFNSQSCFAGKTNCRQGPH